MSYPESPDPLTGKAPVHQATALENAKLALVQMGKTTIRPSSTKLADKYEIIVTKLASPITFEYLRKSYTVSDGYLISHTSPKHFHKILKDIKSIPQAKYVSNLKNWYIPTSSLPELLSFMSKYAIESLEITEIPPLSSGLGELTIENINISNVRNAIRDLGYDAFDHSKTKTIPDYLKTIEQVIRNKISSGYTIPSSTSEHTIVADHIKTLYAEILQEKNHNTSFHLFRVGDKVEAYFDATHHIPAVINFVGSDEIKVTLSEGLVHPNGRNFEPKERISFDYPFVNDEKIVLIDSSSSSQNSQSYASPEVLSRPLSERIYENLTDTSSDDKELTDEELTTYTTKMFSSPNLKNSILNTIKSLGTQWEDTFRPSIAGTVGRIPSSTTHPSKKLSNRNLQNFIKEIEDKYIAESKAKGEKQVDQNEIVKMIKQILKLVYPDTKFSVRGSRYSMGHSIDVRYDLGPTSKEVNALVGKYHDKSFDGMNDSTSYLNTPWNTDSVSVSRNIPDDKRFQVANKILLENELSKTVSTWSEMNVKVNDKWLQDIVNEYFSETSF